MIPLPVFNAANQANVKDDAFGLYAHVVIRAHIHNCSLLFVATFSYLMTSLQRPFLAPLLHTCNIPLDLNIQQARFVILFLVPYVALNHLTPLQRDAICLPTVYQKNSLLPVSLWAVWSCRESDEILLLHITRYCISRNNGVAGWHKEYIEPYNPAIQGIYVFCQCYLKRLGERKFVGSYCMQRQLQEDCRLRGNCRWTDTPNKGLIMYIQLHAHHLEAINRIPE